MKSKEKNAVYLYWSLFIGVFMFLLWKCKFGFGNMDEAFYIAMPYRFCQGDSLFANEWHLAQMSGFLLIPFVKIYTMIVGGTTGIIYSFRILYVIIQALVSLFIFYRLKKINVFGALFSSLGFFLYAPFNISALCYNTMGIMSLTMTLLLFMTEKDGTKKKIELILAGIFFAVSVLCCPYLAVMYVIYTLLVVVCSYVKNKKKVSVDKTLEFSQWLWITIGIFVVFAVFATFVLSRASIKDIASSLKPMFEDPEHPNFSIPGKTIDYVLSSAYPKWSAFAYIPIIISIFDKGRENRKELYMTFGIILELLSLIFFVFANPYPNFSMLPVNILALQCVVLLWNKKTVRELFLKIWIPGMLYSYCLHFSSNQKLYAISSASTVAFVASVIIISLMIKEIILKKSSVIRILIASFLTFCLVVQLVSETYMRYEILFWEGEMSKPFYEIQDGPEKGIMVTENYREEIYDDNYYVSYYNIYNSKEYIENKFGMDKSILFLSLYTWDYLIFDNYRNASCSAWLPGGVNDDSIGRLKRYYEINPEKFPDIVYIDDEYIEDLKHYKTEYEFDSEQLSNGDYIIYNISEIK